MPDSNVPPPADQHSREREARLQAILDAAVEAIITIDEQGLCESANHAVERMFGYKPSELVGQNIRCLMPEPISSEHDGYLRRYLETGEAKIIGIGRETIGRHRDGREFPIHLSVSEVKVERGRLFTGIVHDITEQRDAQRRLVQSERLAVLGEAIARLAHESRNALQRIQIAVETARLHAVGEEPLARQLDAIERANDSLNALLEELRNYAAPLHLERNLTQLSNIWQEAWSTVSHQRADRSVDFSEEPMHEARCHVDRFRLTQVFRNLFENSLAACDDPTEIRIHVEPAQLDNAAAWAITVADNGPGLSEEQASRVFEPFYTTKARGTGLGMAIARRIIEAHGGTLRVAPSPLGGAAFELVLPA